ncbi:hypothetical protein C6P46_003154 [Rhodotorula mucilaginosa]|uniref:Uncharacterized protein n=2 Tax=Rhodotorula mucilaginosa TaxID=5537 RepID=A0A9P7B1H9_RHOMI|nr:hypothetical protein C6P46_003154 [Rhodotorula mucilaginosa]
MAPITFAAAPQDATVQQTAPVNEERNPQVGNYLACTISRKETAAELVDEERNPQFAGEEGSNVQGYAGPALIRFQPFPNPAPSSRSPQRSVQYLLLPTSSSALLSSGIAIRLLRLLASCSRPRAALKAEHVLSLRAVSSWTSRRKTHDGPVSIDPINQEHDPQVGNYLACTISRKETAAELVDEEHNPQVGNYLACIIA